MLLIVMDSIIRFRLNLSTKNFIINYYNMTTKIIHFDSLNSVNNPTTIIDPITTNLITTYHSFNTNYMLSSQLQDINRISLKSIEFPLVFSNIRSTMSPFGYTYTNAVGVNITKSFNQTLPETTYPDIYAVVAALNTFMTTSSGLSISLMTGETVPVFSVITVNRDLRVSYTMSIYPYNSFKLTETFFTSKLLGYVASVDNTAVTTTTRYIKGGVYSTDAQAAYYSSVNNALTLRNDITLASTTNTATSYNPTASTALLTQYTFSMQLLTGSWAPNTSLQIFFNGVVNPNTTVPPFCIVNPNSGAGIPLLVGNPQLIGYKILMNTAVSGFTNIFQTDTYITSIDVSDVAQTNKYICWVTLSKGTTSAFSSATVNYPIQLIANNLSNTTTTFSNPSNINYDTYVNMTIQNMPVVTANNNQLPCTFKIPLNSRGNIVYLNAESNSFVQSVVSSNSHFVLDKLTIIFTDRRGYAIQPNYGNYSFSLAFVFKDTSDENYYTADTTKTTVETETPVIEQHYFTEYW